MPGNRVLSGRLERYVHQQENSEIRFFRVQTFNESLSANLQPFPIPHSVASHRVVDYRCFIPISGYRILATFLEPHPTPLFAPGTIRIYIRIPAENNALYSGVMEVGEGEGPRWIPRHL